MRPSFIHRLDPRTKLILAAALAALVFLADSLAVAAAQALAFAGLARAAGVPFKKIFPHGRLLAFLIASAVILQALFRHGTGGPYLLSPVIPEWVPLAGGLGALRLEGFLFGLVVACRILALAVLMPLLVLTTEARLLAYGITRLGANYRAAHVITSTLNLVRAFEGEVRLILDARRLRGAAARGFAARLAEYRVIALPLMIKVMRRSVAVALVMDSRAFGARRNRTWLISARMSRADFAALALGAAYAAAVLWANSFLP